MLFSTTLCEISSNQKFTNMVVFLLESDMVGVVMELGLGEQGDEFHQRQLVKRE